MTFLLLQYLLIQYFTQFRGIVYIRSYCTCGCNYSIFLLQKPFATSLDIAKGQSYNVFKETGVFLQIAPNP